jgi:hypothetical protein
VGHIATKNVSSQSSLLISFHVLPSTCHFSQPVVILLISVVCMLEF